MRDGARRTHENIWKDLIRQDSVERRRGARTTGDDRFDSEVDDRVGERGVVECLASLLE